MSNDPAYVTHEQLKAALSGLGIGDYEDIREILIKPKGITVQRLRRDAEGRFIHAGEHAATITTEIGLKR